MTKTEVTNILRSTYMDKVKERLESIGEVILQTGNNEFTIPCVDIEGNDRYVQVVVKVPKGSRDGEEFDGYIAAEDYKAECEARAITKAEKEERKAKKIERDKAKRAKKGTE